MMQPINGLTEQDLRDIRVKLETRKAELLQSSEKLRRLELEGLNEAVSGEVHPTIYQQADNASAAMQEDIIADLSAIETRELNDIDNALARLNRGDYGTCERCEEPVPALRLLSLPETRYCFDCAKELEQINKQQRHRPIDRRVSAERLF